MNIVRNKVVTIGGVTSTISMFATSDYPGQWCLGWIRDNNVYSIWRIGSRDYIDNILNSLSM